MTEGADKRKPLRYYDYYLGRLCFETPLHVGTSEVAIGSDSPLLRDAAGRWYLPGSSLIGPLKARASKLLGKDHGLINLVFGYANKDIGVKSRLVVEDAYPAVQHTSIRDGVAIDRKLGSAAPHAKFDLETTPRDISFPLVLRLDQRKGDPADHMRFLCEKLLSDLNDGKIRLGGGKTRGLGRCGVEFAIWRLDWNCSAARTAFLLNKEEIAETPEKAGLKMVEPTPKPDALGLMADNTLDIVLEFQIADSPFLIKHGRDDADYDAVFTRIKQSDGTEVDFVPGASLKGVFRARAEKIVRTLGGQACEPTGADYCGDEIKQFIKENRLKQRDENYIEFIKEKSCPICRLFGNGFLAGRIFFEDAVLLGGQKKKFDSVAIDRFTGGAAEGKLFDAYPVVSGSLKVNLHVEDPTDFDKALILFLLRDLLEQFPPTRFGYGKTKGYGLLTCKKVTLNEKEAANSGEVKGLIDPAPDFKEWWKGGPA